LTTFIDDFFKTEKDKSPSTAEINIAFELLNYRYNAQNSLTLISSEKGLKEITKIDEAVGSRITQSSKGFSLFIPFGEGKNYRLL